ncbi:unnamed protein product, partial [Trichobilharzia szidati]
SEILIETVENKWKARARLDAAEDAQLSRSSVTCVKKEVNRLEKKYMMESVRKKIEQLKRAAEDRLHFLFKAMKHFMLNKNMKIYDYLVEDIEFAKAEYHRGINELVKTAVELEDKRLHYLKCKSV